METDLEVPAHFCLYGYQEQNTLVYFKCLHFEIKSGHETKRCVKILALTYPWGRVSDVRWPYTNGIVKGKINCVSSLGVFLELVHRFYLT